MYGGIFRGLTSTSTAPFNNPRVHFWANWDTRKELPEPFGFPTRREVGIHRRRKVGAGLGCVLYSLGHCFSSI